jgi:hypothetical protein
LGGGQTGRRLEPWRHGRGSRLPWHWLSRHDRRGHRLPGRELLGRQPVLGMLGVLAGRGPGLCVLWLRARMMTAARQRLSVLRRHGGGWGGERPGDVCRRVARGLLSRVARDGLGRVTRRRLGRVRRACLGTVTWGWLTVRDRRLTGRRVLRRPGGMVSRCRVVRWRRRMMARRCKGGQRRRAGQRGGLGRWPRQTRWPWLARLSWQRRRRGLGGEVARG